MRKGVEAVREALRTKKGSSILMGAGICGMLLLCLSALFPYGGDGAADDQTQDGGVLTEENAQTYEEELALELEKLLGQMEGVGECTVMVTTQTGVENVYAVEQSQSANESNRFEGEGLSQQSRQTTETERYILLDAGSGNKQALVKTQKRPEILGVVVVCDGAGDPVVQERVLSAVTTATGISYSRVYVTKRSA